MGYWVMRQRRLGVDNIAAIWHKTPSEVLGYVRARMLFAVLHATDLCIVWAVE